MAITVKSAETSQLRLVTGANGWMSGPGLSPDLDKTEIVALTEKRSQKIILMRVGELEIGAKSTAKYLGDSD